MVSYKKLWKILVDKSMNKHDLMKLTGISSSSMTKLSKGQNITTDILCKICNTLKCNFADIMEYIPEEEQK